VRILKGILFRIEYEGVRIIISISIWKCCVKSIVDISQPVGMSTIQSVRDWIVQLLRSFDRISVELLD
jgi:CO dehydrogenase/acetyl-CoA synthase alpha subunit